MAKPSQNCKATTRRGTRCKNYAIVGSEYCHVHGGRTSPARVIDSQAVDTPLEARSKGSSTSSGRTALLHSSRTQPDMDLLIQELDALIHELRVQIPEFEIDDVGPAHIVRLFNRSVGKRLPATQAALFEDLERNLDEATFADLVDPEVLRGMALLAYYSLQAQTAAIRAPVAGRIRSLPGFALMSDLRNNLSGTSLQDLADPDTWRGLWYIVTYTAQLKLQEMRQGDDDPA